MGCVSLPRRFLKQSVEIQEFFCNLIKILNFRTCLSVIKQLCFKPEDSLTLILSKIKMAEKFLNFLTVLEDLIVGRRKKMMISRMKEAEASKK